MRLLPSPANALVLAALVAGLVLSVASIREEWLVRDLERVANDERGTKPADIAFLPGDAPEALSPRVAALRAVIRASAGELDLAARDAEYATRMRPDWGQAWLADCLVAIAREGSDSQHALNAYRRSYQTSPYLPQAADWRLRYAIAHWPALDARTRAAVIDEARWTIKFSPTQRVHVYVLTGGTPLWTLISGDGRKPYVARPGS
jgi:hypothetical protein